MKGWIPVYKREMLMLYRRIGGLGYFITGLLFPMIYLLAFGWGLGSSVQVAGGYIAYLAKGMLAISVMMNSFQQTVVAIMSSRFYYKTFQTLKMSPVSDASMAFGMALAGVTRGVVAGGIIYLSALIFFGVEVMSVQGAIGLVLTAMCFSSFGIAAGMSINGQEQFSIVNNFVITPMTFFCGSFFPITNLPEVVYHLVQYLPLSLTNGLLRMNVWDISAITSAGLLLCITLTVYFWSINRIRNYNEFR
ncbi:ABC transporter permease [Anaerovibrio sp.]|uniref:ABC transporter permease n=1 Tax=Anaerovibrio sp. TaxID=1872532 RepID=UPI0025BB9635|nr:ABC transporter permease [Anaerovibrio sp.]